MRARVSVRATARNLFGGESFVRSFRGTSVIEGKRKPPLYPFARAGRNRYNRQFAMKRRVWILSVLLVTACERKAPPPVFAPTVADTWHLRMTQTFRRGRHRNSSASRGVRAWWRASCEGPGSMNVELYELAAPPPGSIWCNDGGRWPTQWSGIHALFRCREVAESDRSAVGAFIRALQKQFAEERSDRSARAPAYRFHVTHNREIDTAPSTRAAHTATNASEIGP
jgi:hypothetical protein